MDAKKIMAGAVIIFTALMFYIILVSSGSGIVKFTVSVVLMAGCGICLRVLLGMDGQYGLLLLRTQKGLKYIDDIANAAPRLWQACADFGIVLGFGVSSIFFFKKLPKKTFMVSLLMLILVSQFIAPKVFKVVVALINIPMDLSSMSQQMGSMMSIIPLVVFFAMIFFGLCGVTVVGLILNTYSILWSIAAVVLSVPGKVLSDAVPGASPIIPGINMPLAEGLIALAVLLFFHELSHGILSRIGKVKLDSAGMLLFGLIPVGAFIDPDEKSLEKKDIDAQTRVFAAGSAANLILCIIFFLLLTGFETVTAPQLDSGIYVRSVDSNSSAFNAKIAPGDRLVSVDNTALNWSNIAQFSSIVADKQFVSLATDKGTYVLEPKTQDGKKVLGIRVEQEPRYVPAFSWLGFVKNTLGLIFILNFLVGVINMIPLFMAFDGYRILAIHQKNPLIIKLISYSLFIMFILNFVPWLWR
jgi:membrane-associated protease RseP (regulator of RpoE activity)